MDRGQNQGTFVELNNEGDPRLLYECLPMAWSTLVVLQLILKASPETFMFHLIKMIQSNCLLQRFDLVVCISGNTFVKIRQRMEINVRLEMMTFIVCKGTLMKMLHKGK